MCARHNKAKQHDAGECGCAYDKMDPGGLWLWTVGHGLGRRWSAGLHGQLSAGTPTRQSRECAGADAPTLTWIGTATWTASTPVRMTEQSGNLDTAGVGERTQTLI